MSGYPRIRESFSISLTGRTRKFSIHPETSRRAKLKCMDEETIQALEIIRQRGRKLTPSTIERPSEKRFLEDMTVFALDHSNLEELADDLQAMALDQSGPKNTEEQLTTKARTLFYEILSHHFPEITEEQRKALYEAIQSEIQS